MILYPLIFNLLISFVIHCDIIKKQYLNSFPFYYQYFIELLYI